MRPLRLGEEKRKKEETGRKYICPHPAMQGDHKTEQRQIDTSVCDIG